MSFPARWSCPGSLLIAGEYGITEEGGFGIAVAAGPLARAAAVPAGALSVRGLWAGGRSDWSPSDGADGTPAAAAYEACRPDPTVPAAMTVDTTEFFRAGGMKTGYGSSAAAALLCCRLFSPDAPTGTVVDSAVRAHRAFQGGRGSGYDVLASAYGGTGRFVGGQSPSWTPIEWPRKDELEAWVVHAPKPVSTGGAVARFEEWRRSDTIGSGSLLSRSDAAVDELIGLIENGADPAAVIVRLRGLSAVSREIGEAIGVSAVPFLPEGLSGILTDGSRTDAAVKCLGAGNETALIVSIRGGLAPLERRALERAVRYGLASLLVIHEKGLAEETCE